ncbi:MAG: DUF6020 family protein [Lachnospiraceae bacterium]|nr:DUF6020 family protein [Lachnospiraceae bacterium]MDY5000790.1 DUF6020 family protein [Lachnospiraceae bacterium]
MKKIPNIAIRVIIAYIITFAIYNVGGFETSDIVLGIFFVSAIILLGAIGQNPQSITESSENNPKVNVVSNVLAAIFTLSYSIYMGSRLTGGLENKLFALFYILMTIAGLYIMFFLFIRRILVIFAGPRTSVTIEIPQVAVAQAPKTMNNEEQSAVTESTPAGLNLKLMFIYAGIVFLALLPLFLINFPGTMTVDSFNQLSQARGLTPLHDHHPWVHTLIIKLFYNIGYSLSNNVTVGIAAFILAQMLLVSLGLGFTAETLASLGSGRMGAVIVIAGFILFPYHAAFTITMWKDILFALGVLIITILLYKELVAGIRPGVADSLLFVLSSLAVCLFRHNGFYAYILCALIFAFRAIVNRRSSDAYVGKNARTAILTLVSILICLIINGPVKSGLNVQNGDFGHELAIPLQQIARVVQLNGDISDEELEELARVNSIEYIVNNYEPGGADNMIQWLVAGDSDYVKNNKGRFLKLYLSLGLKNPNAYIMAFIDQTKGYYTTMMPEQTAYYGILPNGDNLDNYPIFGAGVRIKINEILSKLQDVLPVYAIFYSPGACLLILILMIGIEKVRGRRSMLLVFLPQLCLTLTVLIATPLVADLRYAYALMLSMPSLIVMVSTPLFCQKGHNMVD